MFFLFLSGWTENDEGNGIEEDFCLGRCQCLRANFNFACENGIQSNVSEKWDENEEEQTQKKE
jgi:hypothetical protein